MPSRFRIALSLLLLFAGSSVRAADTPAKPNVLFIIVDDLNTRLGCYGDKIAQSPNIDRIAARGVRFDRAYCQSPQCNPSRTSLLSGRYPSTTRILDNDTPSRKYLKDISFLPEHFRANGYFTAKMGKVAHEEFEDEVQWDVADDSKESEERMEQKEKRKKSDKERERDMPEAVAWRALKAPDYETPDGHTAREVVKLLEKRPDKPFFIAAGFHKPHRPYEAPEKYFEAFSGEKMPLPQEPPDVRKGVPEIAFETYDDDAHMPDVYKRGAIRAYYACIQFIDAQIKLLLDQLDKQDLWKNTVVVLASDHGYLLGEHGGMWRKMSLFEEASRVPLIIAAPGKSPGAACPRVVEMVDLYPTLVELCGLKPPEGLEGRSLLPLLAEPQREWNFPAHTFTEHELTKKQSIYGQTLRTERWRYTEWGGGGELGTELYDEQADPKEWRNLAKAPESASTIAELRKLLIPIEQPKRIEKKKNKD